MNYRILFCVLTLTITSYTFAQTDDHVHTDDHSHDHHHHHRNEIGVANSAVYFVNEQELAYGLHLHYVRNIKKSKFGYGLGYERIFDEHGHNTIGLIAAYSPVNNLHLNLSPGLAFEDKESGVAFALHFETSYEFQVNNFHIGPSVEFAYDPKDIHISLGIHVGFGF